MTIIVSEDNGWRYWIQGETEMLDEMGDVYKVLLIVTMRFD